MIKVQYYASDGTGVTASNAAGNIIVVSVVNYPALPIAPLFGRAFHYLVNVAAVDKVEPFPGSPPLRTLP